SCGVDGSIVKFQDDSKIGYTAGALIGFAFNNRWSVESGAYYDQKSYYSDGKYFDPKLYPNLVINSVDGTCHMIELPLSVRYNFKKKENTWRSEEHTSELQSRGHLVCRLLLEKKKELIIEILL